MTEEIHYDVGELLGSSVDAIKAKFSDLSDSQLAMLGEAERGAEKPRSSLLAAVETEQTARAAQAKEVVLMQAAKCSMQEGQQAADQALLGSMSASREAELEARVAELTAENERLNDLVAELQLELEGVAEGNQVDSNVFAALVKMHLAAVCAKPQVIVFSGHGGTMIDDLPWLMFHPSDFRVENGGITLLKPIDFPLHGKAHQVHAIWVVDRQESPTEDGGMAGFACQLLQPLNVGGGRQAHIPAGHLHFTGNAA